MFRYTSTRFQLRKPNVDSEVPRVVAFKNSDPLASAGGVALGLGAVPLLTAEPAHAGVIGARGTQSWS